MTGRSNGTPTSVEGLPGTACNLPPCISNEQPSLISTVSVGRGTSHGSLRRSQLSGHSRCQPSSMDCLNMPYSVTQPVAHRRQLHRQPGRLTRELYNARRLAEPSRWPRNVTTLEKVAGPLFQLSVQRTAPFGRGG